MQKITPFLWFDGNAEEAMNFYVSVFNNSRIVGISRFGEGAHMPAGTVWSGTFEIEGQTFMALNGGPMFQFTPAISLYVNCETQAEIDLLWEKLSVGSKKPGQCGWLEDQFGLSWQIIPPILGRLLGGPEPAKAKAAMAAMMGMQKIDIAALQEAYDRG